MFDGIALVDMYVINEDRERWRTVELVDTGISYTGKMDITFVPLWSKMDYN